ncbi:hypothetical protein ACFYY2_34295 [Streptomyces sp. NPDC001822]|uniref:hypothetical protein n=1 Tax=Streptomyces sp. NPDC001822 TaxID=3364614 RepID=UPI0036B2DFE2
MSSSQKMTVEQELAAAVAIVRVGLDRIRDAATRTGQVGPHAAALQALRDPGNQENGVLAAVADVIGTITVSITEADHDDIDRVVELLDEAQAYAQDYTGERIDKALDLLGPLLPVCLGCGKRGLDVEVMADPFTTALYPGDTDHEQVPYCPPCAVKRFEES